MDDLKPGTKEHAVWAAQERGEPHFWGQVHYRGAWLHATVSETGKSYTLDQSVRVKGWAYPDGRVHENNAECHGCGEHFHTATEDCCSELDGDHYCGGCTETMAADYGYEIFPSV